MDLTRPRAGRGAIEEPGLTREVELDIRGQICPSTLLTALKTVNEHRADLQAGSLRLSFLTDNRDAVATIPDTVRHMGYGVRVAKEAGAYRVTIEEVDGDGGDAC
jgi:TusA-related sulfurtransferase